MKLMQDNNNSRILISIEAKRGIDALTRHQCCRRCNSRPEAVGCVRVCAFLIQGKLFAIRAQDAFFMLQRVIVCTHSPPFVQDSRITVAIKWIRRKSGCYSGALLISTVNPSSYESWRILSTRPHLKSTSNRQKQMDGSLLDTASLSWFGVP
eukprot:GEMP01097390.1.p1 GENE.GEMP01097390.1~~GEMP01097390.1.p1  ORF type:complete len:152 (+),score=4.18 GEMP01097390.1:115-570(+)